jgi:hypothetical protein
LRACKLLQRATPLFTPDQIITIDDVRNDFGVHGRGKLAGQQQQQQQQCHETKIRGANHLPFIVSTVSLESFSTYKRHGHHNCQISFLPTPPLSFVAPKKIKKKNKKISFFKNHFQMIAVMRGVDERPL